MDVKTWEVPCSLLYPEASLKAESRRLDRFNLGIEKLRAFAKKDRRDFYCRSFLLCGGPEHAACRNRFAGGTLIIVCSCPLIWSVSKSNTIRRGLGSIVKIVFQRQSHEPMEFYSYLKEAGVDISVRSSSPTKPRRRTRRSTTRRLEMNCLDGRSPRPKRHTKISPRENRS